MSRAFYIPVLVFIGTGLTTTACSISPEAEGCEVVDPDVVAVIDDRLIETGELGHAMGTTTPQHRFVSVEFRTPNEVDKDRDGDILTLLDLGRGAFAAVDEKARELTSWPEAELDVRTEGAIASRGCTSVARDE